MKLTASTPGRRTVERWREVGLLKDSGEDTAWGQVTTQNGVPKSYRNISPAVAGCVCHLR